MLGDSININDFDWDPVILKKKKILKSLNISIFGSTCTGPQMGHA